MINIKNIISKIYIDKDDSYFNERCKNKIEFNEAFYKQIKVYDIKNIVKEDIDGCPSQRWYFKFSNYENGNFNVSYTTLLQISRIIPVFHIQHEFEIDNKDTSNMCPVLDGFGSQAYIKNQYFLHEYIKKYLENQDYTELDYSQLNETVITLENSNTNMVNGEKFSIEDLLFYGMFEVKDTIE